MENVLVYSQGMTCHRMRSHTHAPNFLQNGLYLNELSVWSTLTFFSVVTPLPRDEWQPKQKRKKYSQRHILLGTIQLLSKNTSRSSHSSVASNTKYVPVWSVEQTNCLNSVIQHENWTYILLSGDINQAWVCWKAKILSLVNETEFCLRFKRVRNAASSSTWLAVWRRTLHSFDF